MSNQQLKSMISSVWKSLKGLKAHQIENKIQISKQLAQTIVGIGQLDKLRNPTLLKMLTYELIAFLDDKINGDKVETTYFSKQNGKSHDNVQSSAASIRDLKQMFYDIIQENSSQGSYITLDRFYINSILRKITNIEAELKQQYIKKKYQDIRVEDPEGTEAMIEQLQIMLKKKQARINQLNSQLQYNFNDKEQLETQIEALQQRNFELEQSVKLLEDQCNLVKDQFEKYKNTQKDQLLFGASQFMNGGFPHKEAQSPLLVPQNKQIPSNMLSSTQMLSRYCSKPQLKIQQLESPVKTYNPDVKTVKKPVFKQVQQEIIQEQNLLESMRIYNNKNDIKNNEDTQMLSRMLLMQAGLIEQVMQQIS